eukprot:2271087-Rhodomonas_salina.1
MHILPPQPLHLPLSPLRLRLPASALFTPRHMLRECPHAAKHCLQEDSFLRHPVARTQRFSRLRDSEFWFSLVMKVLCVSMPGPSIPVYGVRKLRSGHSLLARNRDKDGRPGHDTKI